MKKINVKPAEVLGIEFDDGTIKECKFTAHAMMVLDEEFEGFTKVFEQAQEKPFLAGSKLLYAGMKACNEETTIKEAKAVACNMSIDNILDLFEFAADTINIEEREEESEKKKKVPQDHKKKQK